MNTVKINGHELNVVFNMAVEIEYEDMSGQPFDLEKMNTQKATMQLCYASMKVANSKLPFTFDQLNGIISFSETTELKNAVLTAMHDWLNIPSVMANNDQTPTEEEQKNV